MVIKILYVLITNSTFSLARWKIYDQKYKILHNTLTLKLQFVQNSWGGPKELPGKRILCI